MPSVAQAATNSIIVNADDWGRDVLTTDRMVQCARAGVLSSVSAMVFQPDSERGAALAAEHGIDTGLHLNLSTPLEAKYCPAGLQERQAKIKHFLRSNYLAPVVYHPGLVDAFRYVVAAQIDEYSRIYGHPPLHLDGHHHMHLCINMLLSDFIPQGTIVRKSFSNICSEMSWPKRTFRAWQNRILARHYRTTDFFFSIMPLDPRRLESIVAHVAQGTVEVMTHPVRDEEYRFLLDGGLAGYLGPIEVAHGYKLADRSDG